MSDRIMADNLWLCIMWPSSFFSASLVLDTGIAASKIERKIWKYFRKWKIYQSVVPKFQCYSAENEPENQYFDRSYQKIVSQGSNRAPLHAKKKSTISQWKDQYLRGFDKFICHSKFSASLFFWFTNLLYFYASYYMYIIFLYIVLRIHYKCIYSLGKINISFFTKFFLHFRALVSSL